MLHRIDDVLFDHGLGNTQVLGDLRVCQSFDLAQQETLAAQLWQFGQCALEHVDALAMVEAVEGRWTDIAFFAVQHFQRFDLAQGIAPMIIDHQVQRGAIEKRPRLLDRRVTGAFQDTQVSVMHHIFGHLTVAELGVQETHQLAIVVFQHDSRPHGCGFCP